MQAQFLSECRDCCKVAAGFLLDSSDIAMGFPGDCYDTAAGVAEGLLLNCHGLEGARERAKRSGARPLSLQGPVELIT